MYNSILKNKKEFDKALRQKYKAAALKTINSETTIASDIYLDETKKILEDTRGCISKLKSLVGYSQTSKIINAIKNKPKEYQSCHINIIMQERSVEFSTMIDNRVCNH